MKLLFWILAILSIPASLFVTIVCWMSHGLGLYGTIIGDISCIMGIPAAIVCIVGVVLGIIHLCRSSVKKAVIFVLVGVLYCAAVAGGLVIDEVVDTVLMKADIEKRNEETYGENWNSPPAMEGIPEHYHEVMNEYYAIIRDTWPAEELAIYGAMAMQSYFGDTPLDNIGFALCDLNGDKVDELIIGATAPEETGGTAIFCFYSDSENPSIFPGSHEGEIYYLHPGEKDGTYLLEVVGKDIVWQIEPAGEGEDLWVEDYLGEAPDPSGRMTLELTPFSQYK